MPWRGVTVSEQRQRFLEDFQLNSYSVSELAERLGGHLESSRRRQAWAAARLKHHPLCSPAHGQDISNHNV